MTAVIVPFVRASFKDFCATITKWWPFFLVLLLLNSGANYLESPMVRGGDVFYYQLFLVLSYVVVSGMTTIRFMERFEKTEFSKEQYSFGAFTYTLYILAYFSLVLLGAVLLIIPFFIFGTFFILAPLVALREDEGNAFERSFAYVKKRPSVAFLLFLGLIAPEFFSYLGVLLEEGSKSFYAVMALLTFFESIFSIFVLKLIVDFYYGLKAQASN